MRRFGSALVLAMVLGITLFSLSRTAPGLAQNGPEAVQPPPLLFDL